MILDQLGEYLIKVGSAATGTYRLTIQEITPTLIGGDVSSPMPGELSQQAIWAFDVENPQIVSIAMDGVDNIDSFITLYAPDGAVLQSNDDFGGSRNSRIDRYPLAQPGRYLIEVRDYNYSPAGRYTITLEKETPTFLNVDQPHPGRLTEGGSWRVRGQPGQVLTLNFETTAVDLYPQLTLVSPAGLTGFAGPGFMVIFTEDTEDYLLVLPRFPDATEAYTYTVSLTANSPQKPVISYVKEITGALAAATTDYWRFSGKARQSVIITTTSSVFSPQLMFYGPDGSPLGQPQTSTTGAATLVVPTLLTGTYVIAVHADDSQAAGPYMLTTNSINVEALPIPQDCGMTHNVDYGSIVVGSMVILGRHHPFNGETYWNEADMPRYVGRQAEVTSLAGVDPQGCPWVHVDIDNGQFSWRIRDMSLIR